MKKFISLAMILLLSVSVVFSAEKAEWTVMVYLAADNNLEEAGYQNIYEMAKIGSSKNLNIVCLFDDLKKEESYIVKVNKSEQNVSFKNWDMYKDPAIEITTIDEVNSGDPEVLYGFVKHVAEKHPANKYFLLFWNHGSGFYTVSHAAAAEHGNFDNEPVVEDSEKPVTNGRFSTARIKVRPNQNLDSIAYDDNSNGDSLTQIELKAVFAQLKEETAINFDIIGFDACLMNNVEVVSQLAPFAKVVIGSEESEPGAGWDYEGFLKPIAQNPQISLEDLSETLCKTYIKKSSKGVMNKIRFLMSPMPLTLASVDTVKIADVEKAVDNLAKSMIIYLQKSPLEALEAFTKAQANSQTYSYKFYVDLVDLCKKIKKYSKDKTVQNAAGQVIKTVSGGMFSKGAVIASETKYTKQSHGLTIFYPSFDIPMSALKSYKLLDFAERTSWDDMIALLMRKLPKVKVGDVYRTKTDGKYSMGIDILNETRSRDSFNIKAEFVQFEGSFVANLLQKLQVKKIGFEKNPVNAQLKPNTNPRIDFTPVIDPKLKAWAEKNQDKLGDMSMKLVVSLDNGYVLTETAFRYSTILGMNAKMTADFPAKYHAEIFTKIDQAIAQAGITPEHPQYAQAIGGVFNQIKGEMYKYFFQYPNEIEIENLSIFVNYLLSQKKNSDLSVNSKVILNLYVNDLEKVLSEVLMTLGENDTTKESVGEFINVIKSISFLE